MFKHILISMPFVYSLIWRLITGVLFNLHDDRNDCLLFFLFCIKAIE